jgi:Domain of unknown function (DUF4411)
MKAIPVASQWDFFLRLAELVADGTLAIPIHVIREVADVQHPDMPGAWAKGMQKRMVHALEADPKYVARVMTEVPNVLDLDADTEQADPFVLALALHLANQGHAPTVVTKDKKDRPPHISLRTACTRMSIPCVFLHEFLQSIAETS